MYNPPEAGPMEIRPFDSSDTEQLLMVFRKSVPAAFGANEVDE